MVDSSFWRFWTNDRLFWLFYLVNTLSVFILFPGDKKNEAVVMFKKYTPIILILLLALMLRVIALNQSFWLDETIQATVSNSNSSSINWSNVSSVQYIILSPIAKLNN